MRDVSRSKVFAKVGAAHHNCHAHARLLIAWAQFDATVSLKHSVELDAPATLPVLLVQWKFLGTAIKLPVGFCGQFCAVERVTVSKTQRTDGSCTVSEGHDLL
jgi:hypothetical protein